MENRVEQSAEVGRAALAKLHHEIQARPKKKTFTFSCWWRSCSFVPLSKVSRTHLYEARERYFNLMELIRYHARLLGLNLPDFENEDFVFPDDIRKLEREISSGYSNDEKKKNKIFTLLSCYETLIDTRHLLTRKQGDLNRIWRALTRVRSRINSLITTPEMQSSQLYFCQEEAYRLGVDDDPRIKSMLQDLAEAIDSKGLDTAPRYTCVLHALIERFNTIRTGRIHQQFINIRTYWVAFSVLMAISVLLIYNHDVILNKKPLTAVPVVLQDSVATLTDGEVRGDDSISESVMTPVVIPADEIETVSGESSQTPSFISVTLQEIQKYLKQNMLAFIFLGGLTGGFFSVTTRTRSRDFIPGEDAYYTVYILTKPFIGAFGAIILYILTQGDFVTQDVINVKTMENLKEPGPVSFGFALIAGFSERVVFPKFR